MTFFFRIIFIFQLFFLTLFANNDLKHEYFVKHKEVMLSDIVRNPKKDYILYNINSSRHSKRVKASKLLQKLHEYGYNDFHTKYSYIQFSQKSPINLNPIKNLVQKYYIQHYKNITIKNLNIQPNRYIKVLPKNYTIGFASHAYLSHKGVFYIKTPKNKKIFFHYFINASIQVYETKKDLKKGDELSFINCKKKSIILDKFRAMPLMELPQGHYEAKHRIKKSTLLTQRDVTTLYLIKRGSQISVSLQDSGVNITFFGRAVQNGRYGDTIAVTHKNKKIYVIVTGKNRAKVK